MEPIDRFTAKYRVSESGCWEWTAFHNACGYGMFRLDGRTQLAHRAAYELLVGPIPDGLEIDHLCRTRHCVNPAHLEPVDHRTNVLRGDTFQAHNAALTHCKRGHEFTPVNTYREASGSRRCIACRRERRRAARQAA